MKAREYLFNAIGFGLIFTMPIERSFSAYLLTIFIMVLCISLGRGWVWQKDKRD